MKYKRLTVALAAVSVLFATMLCLYSFRLSDRPVAVFKTYSGFTAAEDFAPDSGRSDEIERKKPWEDIDPGFNLRPGDGRRPRDRRNPHGIVIPPAPDSGDSSEN